MQDLARFLSCSKLFDGSESASPFGTRWGHHNSTTSAWRFMAVYGGSRRSAASENRLDSAHGGSIAVNRRFRDGSYNHGVLGVNPGLAESLLRRSEKEDSRSPPTGRYQERGRALLLKVSRSSVKRYAKLAEEGRSR